MKKIVLLLSSIYLAVLFFSCNDTAYKNVSLVSDLDSVSYAIGMNIGRSFTGQLPEINVVAFGKGIKDIMDTTMTTMIPVEDIEKVIQPYFTKKQEKDLKKNQEEQEVKYAGVKEKGIAFLEENKKREGVVTNASGLQYEILKKGSGEKPSATSTVEVHYHGTTPEGLVFDSSVDRGKPVQFPLNGVIAGWTEGLQLMSKGAKYRFYIPQELAYGTNPPQGGQGPIKPFMPLVFEVELIKIIKK